METMRIAPKFGYDFPAKNLYRCQFWNYAARNIDLPTCEAHALLMPSLEGLEIDVALSKGFLEAHLHIVDQNPAIVATLKRRYPQINTYGVSVQRALSQRVRVGLSVVNLD